MPLTDTGKPAYVSTDSHFAEIAAPDNTAPVAEALTVTVAVHCHFGAEYFFDIVSDTFMYAGTGLGEGDGGKGLGEGDGLALGEGDGLGTGEGDGLAFGEGEGLGFGTGEGEGLAIGEGEGLGVAGGGDGLGEGLGDSFGDGLGGAKTAGQVPQEACSHTSNTQTSCSELRWL